MSRQQEQQQREEKQKAKEHQALSRAGHSHRHTRDRDRDRKGSVLCGLQFGDVTTALWIAGNTRHPYRHGEHDVNAAPGWAPGALVFLWCCWSSWISCTSCTSWIFWPPVSPGAPVSPDLLYLLELLCLLYLLYLLASDKLQALTRLSKLPTKGTWMTPPMWLPLQGVQDCWQGHLWPGDGGPRSLTAPRCHQGTGSALCPELSLTNCIHPSLWASCSPWYQTEPGNPHMQRGILSFSLHPGQGSRASQPQGIPVCWEALEPELHRDMAHSLSASEKHRKKTGLEKNQALKTSKTQCTVLFSFSLVKEY